MSGGEAIGSCLPSRFSLAFVPLLSIASLDTWIYTLLSIRSRNTFSWSPHTLLISFPSQFRKIFQQFKTFTVNEIRSRKVYPEIPSDSFQPFKTEITTLPFANFSISFSSQLFILHNFGTVFPFFDASSGQFDSLWLNQPQFLFNKHAIIVMMLQFLNWR